jgi:hypothetical protein
MIRLICQKITQEEVASVGEEVSVEPTTIQEKVEVLWQHDFATFNCHTLGDICQQLLNGEPVFIIRAQDKLSVDAISGYKSLVWKKNIRNIVKRINDSIREFREWRKNNKNRVRLPD